MGINVPAISLVTHDNRTGKKDTSYQCRHFLNTRSAFTTPAAEDEEEPDENQTTTFDAEAAEDTE